MLKFLYFMSNDTGCKYTIKFKFVYNVETKWISFVSRQFNENLTIVLFIYPKLLHKINAVT